MSRIYSALNERTNETVSLYHNTVKGNYEVIVLGSHVRHYEKLSLDVANRIYNEELR